jgi:energy-coupling factor transport system permease protein
VSYRRLASPLHAARAAAGGAYCVALAVAALATEHPLLLAAVAAAVAGAAVGAGVAHDLARAAWLGLGLALLIVLVNVLVARQGLTVFARLGEVPPLGQVDLTVESLVYGALLGARIVIVLGAFAVFTAAVDPDEVLVLFRRVSFRSALTAALATRMVPVLLRDARRLEAARRCRADAGGHGPAAKTAVVRAVATGALDRAVDVAATLEVRGYGAPVARGARSHSPWSRHDVAFMAAAIAVVALVAGARALGLAGFEAYPRIELGLGAGEAAVALALVAAALLPFADRRGIER